VTIAQSTPVDMYEVLLPESHVVGKTLGRHVLHDPRSKEFPADQASTVRSVCHAAPRRPLDQGMHHCSTAHALVSVINSYSSSTRPATLDEEDAIKIFAEACRIRGVDAAADPGGSGLMACKAASSLGLIDGYTHAFGIDHALRALVRRPVITGISWYDSFDEPDPVTWEITREPGASVRGGHEVVVTGIDIERARVWCWNSWGSGYGQGGRFAMSFDTWASLLEDDGDVTVPIL
jgi:hypothetical protein